MERSREIVLHQSANRPNLLLGGDRELVLIAAMLAASLIFVIASWWGVLIGVLLWAAAVAILKRMGKADPMLRQVYVRHVKYQPFYPAKSFIRSRTSDIPVAWR
jgi:type IV secretory pathway TrbD component